MFEPHFVVLFILDVAWMDTQRWHDNWFVTIEVKFVEVVYLRDRTGVFFTEVELGLILFLMGGVGSYEFNAFLVGRLNVVLSLLFRVVEEVSVAVEVDFSKIDIFLHRL